MLVPLLVGALLWAPVHSLEVTNTSSCVESCGDGLTETSQLMCHDALYDSTETGRETRDCLLCLSTSSEYRTPVENDVYWFLFHQKYTIQYCLFDSPGDSSAMPDCKSACLPLGPVFLRLWHQEEGLVPLYDYCSLNGGALEEYADECQSCARKHEGSVILANFMTNLQSACELRPNASNGDLVSLAQPLFATSMTAPSATPTSPPSDGGEGSGSSGLSTGASAGIGVGVAAVVIIIIALLIWLWFRRKRQNRVIQPSPEPIKHDYFPQDRLAAVPASEVDNNMVTDGRTQTGGAWRSELSST